VAGAGHTEDGFTDMYESLRTGSAPDSPTVVNALANLQFPHPVSSVTICGHSLGGALATLLALDLVANTAFAEPAVYTYGSPRTGDSLFAATYNQVVKNSYRVTNRLDVITALPPTFVGYEHVLTPYELNPARLVTCTLICEHSLATYLHLLSLQTGGPVLPLDPACKP
jgi:pimeloyl-ACP methyl ester carboxylesterase